MRYPAGVVEGRVGQLQLSGSVETKFAGKMSFAAFSVPVTLGSVFITAPVAVSPSRHRQQLNSFRRSSYQKRPSLSCQTAASTSPAPATLPYSRHIWKFNSFAVHYATAGAQPSNDSAPPIVLVHGFGANSQHWRRNLRPLADAGFRVYALDLLGFGLGDKPASNTPDADGQLVQYTFDYWTIQLRAFIREIVQPNSHRPVYLVANSIGCMVTMQLAVETPSMCAAQIFISPSLRQLNVRKRSWFQNLTAPLLMRLLSYRPLGAFFLNAIATPKQLRNVLCEAYAVTDCIDDQLIDILGTPAYTPGALDVFLAFIMYDTGPIPEDFLPLLTQPSLIIWGEEDRFEPFELGQALKHYSTVEAFVSLPAVGHCAHDENPEAVNELITNFANKHLQTSAVSES